MLVAMNIPDDLVMEQCYDLLSVNLFFVKWLMGMPFLSRLSKSYKMMIEGGGSK